MWGRRGNLGRKIAEDLQIWRTTRSMQGRPEGHACNLFSFSPLPERFRKQYREGRERERRSVDSTRFRQCDRDGVRAIGPLAAAARDSLLVCSPSPATADTVKLWCKGNTLKPQSDMVVFCFNNEPPLILGDRKWIETYLQLL